MDATHSRQSPKAGGPPLRRVVLSEQVKDFIMEAILDGEFKPGDRVVESALARRLGVSQAPVREALRDLVMMGFLESVPHRGAFVRSFSVDEQHEVYVVRAALESLAARLAATRLAEVDIEKLQGILDGMIQAGRERSLERMTRLDNEFHETILEIAGNKLLRHLWQRLQFGRMTIFTARQSSMDLEYLAARHKELLNALETRDPAVATRAMRRHIEDLGRPPENPE